MRIIEVQLEVSEYFEKGQCGECPFSYEESYYDEDDGYEYWDSCSLGMKWDSCRLKYKEINKEEAVNYNAM